MPPPCRDARPTRWPPCRGRERAPLARRGGPSGTRGSPRQQYRPGALWTLGRVDRDADRRIRARRGSPQATFTGAEWRSPRAAASRRRVPPSMSSATRRDYPAGARAGANTLRAVPDVALPVVAARASPHPSCAAPMPSRCSSAVAAEDQLAPATPADWFFPVRQLLGAQLLTRERPAQAERVYRVDLRHHPGTAGRSMDWSARCGPSVRSARRAVRAASSSPPGRRRMCDWWRPPSGLRAPTRPAASVSARLQPTGNRVVNFLVRSTKLVLTERTA